MMAIFAILLLALLAVPAAFAIATWAIARRAERLAPRAGHIAAVSGAVLHYTDEGSGPPIVMIHGLAAQLHNFTYGVTGRLTGRYRVICIDRPGAGYSTVTAPQHPNLRAQAAAIAALLRDLGVSRPLVVGHSLGGAVSLALALDHPGQVGALALLSPLTQPQDDIPKAFAKLIIQSPAVRHFASRTLMTPLGWLGRHRTQAAVFGPEPAPADFDTRGGNGLLFRPASIFAASSEVSAGSGELITMGERYSDLAVPVAILFARQDAILDPQVHGRAMLARGGARISLELIEGGHMFPLTRPDETAAWIDRQARALPSQPHDPKVPDA